MNEYYEIMDKYAKTIEVLISTFGEENFTKDFTLPESFLPYPKKKIRHAIEELIQFHEAIKAMPEKTKKMIDLKKDFGELNILDAPDFYIDILKAGLEALDHFIPDRKCESLSNGTSKIRLNDVKDRKI